ncbi:MAG: hypothetical protein V1729_02825 [Candidatus Woesearchaeota archaeon]
MGKGNDIDDLGNVVELNAVKDTSASRHILVPTEIIEQLSGLLPQNRKDKVTRTEDMGQVIHIGQKKIASSTPTPEVYEIKLPSPLPIPIPGTKEPEPVELIPHILTPNEEAEKEEKLQAFYEFSAKHFAKYRPPTLEEHIAGLKAKENAPKDLLEAEKKALRKAKQTILGTFTRTTLRAQDATPDHEIRASIIEHTNNVYQAFRQIDEEKRITPTHRGAAKALGAVDMLGKYREQNLKLQSINSIGSHLAPLKESVVSDEDDHLLDTMIIKSGRAIMHKGNRQVNAKQSMFLGDALQLVNRGEYLPNRSMERAVSALEVETEFVKYKRFQAEMRKIYSDPHIEFQHFIDDVMSIRDYDLKGEAYPAQKGKIRCELLLKGGLKRKDQILEDEIESALAIKREEEQKILLQRAYAMPQLAGEHEMYVKLFFGTLSHNLEENMYRRAEVMRDVDEENFVEKAKPELYKATDDTTEQLRYQMPEFCEKIQGAVKMTIYALMADYIVNIDLHRRRIRRKPSRRLG